MWHSFGEYSKLNKTNSMKHLDLIQILNAKDEKASNYKFENYELDGHYNSTHILNAKRTQSFFDVNSRVFPTEGHGRTQRFFKRKEEKAKLLKTKYSLK